ncbi:hypothetical protein B0H16DRAFT_1470721 [Mycena metata]|uniref:Secreted protein n=1 Tax=Mycena metata TaxID=1033252 RepID=A0AAD7MQS1_9AGAR|nr:hypothetical protein B0H16DRAFT_1470721 [Mycena metata]
MSSLSVVPRLLLLAAALRSFSAFPCRHGLDRPSSQPSAAALSSNCLLKTSVGYWQALQDDIAGTIMAVLIQLGGESDTTVHHLRNSNAFNHWLESQEMNT